MPTRISGWIVALALLGATFLMSREGGTVSWRDTLAPIVAWIVLGEAACRVLRLLAPAPLPRRWVWANGVVLTAATTLVLPVLLPELLRDPGPAGLAFAALAVAMAWLCCDLLALLLWRLSRAPAPPAVSAGRVVLWAMVACGLALVVLVPGLDKGDAALPPLLYALGGLAFLLILSTVFFDYPAALDRRRRHQDGEFHDLVAEAPPPRRGRLMPGLRR